VAEYAKIWRMNYTTTPSTIRRPSSRASACALMTREVERRYWPRVNAFFVSLVALSCGVGFSAVLWRLGMEEMAWRYPFALLLAYGVTLILMWGWSRRARWEENLDIPHGGGGSSGNAGGSGSSDGFSGAGGEFSGAGASASFDTVASEGGSIAGKATSGGLELFSGEVEALPFAITLAVLAALAMLFGALAFSVASLVWSAPALLAELMIDAGTAGLLLVHVRACDRRNWLTTACRKTLPAFAILGVLLALLGCALSYIDPTAITVFDVLALRAP
jgi:hypothetical protein